MEALLAMAGCPREDIDAVVKGLQDCHVMSVGQLRVSLEAGQELSDYGIHGVPWKAKFKTLLLKSQPEIACSHYEAVLASDAAALAYRLEGNKFEEFKEKHRPLLLQSLQCRRSGQKYVISVAKQSTSVILVVAFAGTHAQGDWPTNLNVSVASKTTIGGGAHCGFAHRAESALKEYGLHRVLVNFGCNTVLLAGHSMGGAVAHLAGCILRRSTQFNSVKVLSVAFGSPFCVTRDLAETIQARRGWEAHILTVVNVGDPVPSLLNITATIRCARDDSAKLWEEASQLASMLAGASEGPDSKSTAMQRMVDALKGAVPNPDTQFMKDKLDVYFPIGAYIFFDRTRQSAYSSKATYVKEDLSGAKLFRDKWSLLGLINHDGLVRHSMDDYLQMVTSESFTKLLQVPARRSLDHLESVKVSNTESLAFSVDSASYTVEDRTKKTLRFHLAGEGLDFVDPSGVQLKGIANVMSIIPIHMKNAYLVFEVAVGEIPVGSITIDIHSDVNVPVLTSKAVLLSCETSDGGDAVLPEFDDKFIARMLKAAALRRVYGHDDELLQLLGKLDDMYPQHTVNDDGMRSPRKFVDFSTSRDVEFVGRGAETKEHIDQFYSWFLPDCGHPLTTKGRRAGIIIIGSGAILLSGGLAGYASALAAALGVGGVAYAFGQVRMKAKYNDLLIDLHSWSGNTYPFVAPSQQDRLEKAVLVVLSKQEQDHGKDKMFTAPWHSEATEGSKKTLAKLYGTVQIIHSLKKAFGRSVCIAVCGPQNAGKTLLVSQLMMKPEISKSGSGHHTHTSSTVVYCWAPNVYIMDTPGLTSYEASLREIFGEGGGMVSTIFIYMRTFAKPDMADAEVVHKLLSSSAVMSPHILVCLNRCLGSLVDGATGTYLPKADLDKILDVAPMQKAARQLAQDSGYVALLKEKFSPWHTNAWSNVKVVMSELGTYSDETPPVPSDVRKLIWDCSAIAAWMRGIIGRSPGDYPAVDRDTWQTKYNECTRNSKL